MRLFLPNAAGRFFRFPEGGIFLAWVLFFAFQRIVHYTVKYPDKNMRDDIINAVSIFFMFTN